MITCVQSGLAFLLLTYCTIEGDTHLHAFYTGVCIYFSFTIMLSDSKVTLLLPSQSFLYV